MPRATLHPRRSFLKSATAFATGAAALPMAGLPRETTPSPAARELPDVFGPRAGYTPQIGTFVSQLTWMRGAVTRAVKSITPPDLDWLLDANANSVGALLLHLAATETYYQMNTFGGISWDGWPADVKAKWDPAMKLGDAGRKTIKGHDLAFYLAALEESREHTLSEFKKRDDTWFMAVDETWPWGPTNNFCKWFHVCEHESHHAGQIDLLLKRAPGAKTMAS